MRRRQINILRMQEAEQQRMEVIRGESQETDAEAGQGRQEVLVDVDGAKVCPKCGKHLGRGAHFHVRACKG